MRITVRVQLKLPTAAGIGGRRIRPGFVHAPHRQSEGFAYAISRLNQRFFSSVLGSVTSTIPTLRLRRTVPV
jgi:hypothetical protein